MAVNTSSLDDALALAASSAIATEAMRSMMIECEVDGRDGIVSSRQPYISIF